MSPSSQSEQLLARIRDAFQGIELEDGVGLNQAFVIDSYGTQEEEQAVRANDEQHDWQKLVNLPRIESMLGQALCFFDDKGKKFHLPVCLTVMVLNPQASYHLAQQVAPFHFDADDLLNDVQRECVADVVQFVLRAIPLVHPPFATMDAKTLAGSIHPNNNNNNTISLADYTELLKSPIQTVVVTESISSIKPVTNE